MCSLVVCFPCANCTDTITRSAALSPETGALSPETAALSPETAAQSSGTAAQSPEAAAQFPATNVVAYTAIRIKNNTEHIWL